MIPQKGISDLPDLIGTQLVPRVEHQNGSLIINADDWGRDSETTGQILNCVTRGTVSSVSAMVFMADSERAADLAQERGIDAGLHLNFTTPFSQAVKPRLREHQQQIMRCLRRHRFSPVLFHPALVRSFEYVVAAQRDEFLRIYGTDPKRLDGHHHMHLCSNVLIARLLPPGTIVRRNFSFQPGEKPLLNRLYRRAMDGLLGRGHHLTDFFFSLTPLEPQDRVTRIFSLARRFTVEVETHPINSDEYRFLADGDIFRLAGDISIARNYDVIRPRGVGTP